MIGGGEGSFVGKAHRQSVSLDGMAELVSGVFSRNRDKSLSFAKNIGIQPERCYSNYFEMAEQEAAREDGIDFAVIVTPNVSHYEICKAFLEKGIHIVCEKPLCLSSKQAIELLKIAKKKGCLFMVTYTYMGYVTIKSIKDYIKSGKLGKIRIVMAEYPQGWMNKFDKKSPQRTLWRLDPMQSGSVNCLGDLGTHVENIISETTGLKIKRVLAKLENLSSNGILDDNDYILIEYEGGASGFYWTSQLASGSSNGLRIRIYGEKGAIHWFQEDCNAFELVNTDGVITRICRGSNEISETAALYNRLPAGHPEGWIEAIGNLYKNYIACVIAKKEGKFAESMIDFPTGKSGAEGIRFIEKCLESNSEGNIWIDYM